MCDDCLRMSNIWLGLGLTPGQRFGICGDNSYEYMVCLLSGILIEKINLVKYLTQFKQNNHLGIFVGGAAVPMRGIDTIGSVLHFC